MKRALITGITGQTGSYLAELLLEKGYEVHGTVRRSSTMNRERIDHIADKLQLHYADLSDENSLRNAVEASNPSEVYNLAAQSHVRTSFDIPEYTSDVNALGTLRLLEACKGRNIRFYQASTSEMFGAAAPPQNEQTMFIPRSPYGISKLYGFWTVSNYRESHGMYACNGILFNHESPRRGVSFVTQKIVKGAVDIYHGVKNTLMLGNLESKRDWGYAPEYAYAMYLMLQQDKPDDYVIATGETHTIREFCEHAFGYLGLNYEHYVQIDPKYYRPTEVDVLLGDASKARRILHWEPKIKFADLVKIMVDSEMYGKERKA